MGLFTSHLKTASTHTIGKDMNICWIDLETFNGTVDLRKCGSYKYAESCEIMLLSYAWGDDDVFVHDFTEDHCFPAALVLMLMECDAVGAHNGILFDRPVLLRSRYAKHFADKQWHDTMVRAYSHSLPGGLDLLCDIFKLPMDKAKDKNGKDLVNFFCKPLPRTSTFRRATSRTHPEKWAEFKEYAKMDIVAMRTIDKKIPHWNETQFERDLQNMDMRMNDRGFAADLDLCHKAIDILRFEKDTRDDRISDITSDTVGSATQRDALLKYVCDIWHIDLPDMKKATLERRLTDPDISDAVKEILELRLLSAGTATKKYSAFENVACADGRIRGTQQFRGATRTGRWGGRLVQPHNMMRPKFKWPQINDAITLVKNDALHLLYDDSAVKILSDCVRSVIYRPTGTFGISDLSAIEGRVLPYLAGEDWKLKAYRQYDAGDGFDMYTLTYVMIFGGNPAEVTSYQRQLGKVMELALGYGGGVGAYITFAMVYGIVLQDIADLMYDKLPDWARDGAEKWWQESVKQSRTYDLPHDVFVTCDAMKRLWRKASPATCAFWNDLETGVRNVLSGRCADAAAGKIAIDKKGTWLRLRLPSGRYLSYPGAHLELDTIKYLGINQYSRKWCVLTTYGGKMAENATQAFAADVFGHGMLLADSAGLDPVLLVHDEGVVEGDTDTLVKCMTTVPAWATGLPLSAAGYSSQRYRKEK
jgi:DNA polymerase